MKSFYRLHPTYRHGADTPWGGDALRRVFGKDIPDDRTGEALEGSTLPGLESTLDDGRTLRQLVGGELPLLLKLIDAREMLSAQVHPDDAYAAREGKRGKTEAWVILHAQPGARLVYGLKEGTDLAALDGQDMQEHLRWIDVKAGDVFYIPAGMVHAIGGGILLYEIQQSSDITYRFWDWGRTDEQGNARPLHWRQACEVTRTDLQCMSVTGERHPQPGGALTRYLSTPFFTLDRLHAQGQTALPVREGFQYVTALCGGTLEADGETLAFQAGETIFVPEGARDVQVHATGDLLISSGAE